MRRTLPYAPSAKTIATMSMPCLTAVDSSWTLYMKPPSPETETTGRSGRPTLAPRAVARERHPPDIADLRQILDIDPVIGQFGADRLEVFALRTELVGEVCQG